MEHQPNHRKNSNKPTPRKSKTLNGTPTQPPQGLQQTYTQKIQNTRKNTNPTTARTPTNHHHRNNHAPITKFSTLRRGFKEMGFEWRRKKKRREKKEREKIVQNEKKGKKKLKWAGEYAGRK
jgi:hypothetical protein